jgi:hypothetical protein
LAFWEFALAQAHSRALTRWREQIEIRAIFAAESFLVVS